MKYVDKSSSQIPYPASYYVRAFKQLDKTGQCTFNCAAAAFGPFWMLYRKMYLWSLLIVLSFSFSYIFLLKITMSFKYFLSSNSHVRIICWLCYQVVSTYIYGKYGNRLYYKHVKEKVSQGYHLTKGISATMSAGIVTMIAIFFPILSLWLAYLILKSLLPFMETKVIRCSQYVADISSFMLFPLILMIYHKFDLMMLKKSQVNNKVGEAEISEANIKKYLLLNKSNIYVKVFNILISVIMLAFAYYTIIHWY